MIVRIIKCFNNKGYKILLNGICTSIVYTKTDLEELQNEINAILQFDEG